MCTYRRIIFDCNHVAWGNRVKRCTIGEDYHQGTVIHDCIIKHGHPLHSRKVPHDCDRCIRLKRASECFWANIQECREEFSKATISHPTEAEGDVDVKPTDSEGMEQREASDTRAAEDLEPDPMPESDQASQVTENRDGWIYSENGRLQSNGREVEGVPESRNLANNKNLEPPTLDSKENLAAEAVQASEQPGRSIPRQRSVGASPTVRKSSIPFGTGIQTSMEPKPTLKKDREMGRAIPTLCSIPRPRSITVAENPHTDRTPRQALRTPHKPSDGKVMRIPLPTRR